MVDSFALSELYNKSPRYIAADRQLLRSEKLQNESSPNFSNFRPEFCSEFSLKCLKSFRASFRMKRRPEKKKKKHPKSPPFFNTKNPGKFKEKSTKFS